VQNSRQVADFIVTDLPEIRHVRRG
jgi:hypothetical protein